MAEILVIVAGPLGVGKSAVLGKIEIALQAIGLTVRYGDDKAAQIERELTLREGLEELHHAMPSILLIEQVEHPISHKAKEIIAAVPTGQGWSARLHVAIDHAISATWWRGYAAGLTGKDQKW